MHSDSHPNLTALPVAFDMICGMDIDYRINGTRQTLKVRGIAAESTEVGEYFNSISRYYIFKDDVTVLTQLSLGTNNETYVFGFHGPASAIINAIGAYYVVV
ncbi:hypothetical protein C4D60_Mb00t07120 [Musa balbisiana]|uniref:Jacalin-type lectin domain-containing protein n=1 Tax=Musa balbisiana TaxID=52838 RepID=A0A4S8I712_MUSBA|nr:hypothetical protein C4D60_Mb00t07120 [Musa balbisiana]